jgi:tetratricopeptide (TPR) repeat protein
VEQGNLAAAQKTIEQATKLDSRSASMLAVGGELLLLTRQVAEGIASIEQAMKINRNETFDALGLPVEDGSEDRGVDTKLRALCHTAASTLESYAASEDTKHLALVALHALAGDEEKAAQSSSSPSVTDVAGAVAIDPHHDEDVEMSLLRSLKTHPDDRMAKFHLALVRRKISRSQLRQLLEVAADSYHVHQMLGQLYASREEDEKALAEYLAVATAQPDLPGVHFWLGHLYWKHGDADHAVKELTRELELSPGNAEANGELGTVLMAQDRVEQAIPHLEAAIRSKPDLWPAYAQLGKAYASEKKYAHAEQMLNGALIHDRDGSTNYQLALVLRAEGKTAQAARAFAQVRTIRSERMAAATLGDAESGSIKP